MLGGLGIRGASVAVGGIQKFLSDLDVIEKESHPEKVSESVMRLDAMYFDLCQFFAADGFVYHRLIKLRGQLNRDFKGNENSSTTFGAFKDHLSTLYKLLEAVDNNEKWVYSDDGPKVKHSNRFTRIKQVIAKSKGVCGYCRREGVANTIDLFISKEIEPRLADSQDNMVAACSVCNTRKGAHNVIRDPIFHPNFDSFEHHYELEVTGELRAKTVLAQRAVDILNLNSAKFTLDRAQKDVVRSSVVDGETLSTVGLDTENVFEEPVLDEDAEGVESEAPSYRFDADLKIDSQFEGDELQRREYAEHIAKKLAGVFRENEKADEKSKRQGDESSTSFSMHLTGRWGEGKSHFLELLKKEMESGVSGVEWQVIEFDAWRNQHLIPNWWGFLEVVRTKILEKLKFPWSFLFKVRLIHISRAEVLPFALLCFLVVGGYYWPDFVKALGDFISGESAQWSWVGEVKSGGFVFLGGAAVTIVSKWWNSRIASASKLRSLHKSATQNEYEQASNYFSKLTSKAFGDKPIAIFVDDIDRCSPGNVVRLLEAIHTLFKRNNTLYVVSGDSTWVRKCFDLEYADLSDAIANEGCGVGNYFLEKLFQVSIRLPVPENQNLLDDQLYGVLPGDDEPDGGSGENKDEAIKSEEKEVADVPDDVTERGVDSSDGSDHINDEEPESRFFDKEYTEEVKKQSSYILRHFAHLFGKNPRVKERILNTYELRRACIDFETPAGEEKRISNRSLVSLVVLELRWPQYLEAFKRDNKLFSHVSNISSKIVEFDGLVFESDPDILAVKKICEKYQLNLLQAVGTTDFNELVENVNWRDISDYYGASSR